MDAGDRAGGDGALLMTAQEWGSTPVGLDLRRASVGGLKKIGLEAHVLDIAHMPPTSGIAVISMADVLEHMPFPAKGLEAAHRLLEPDGALFVSMPHNDCATRRVLDQSNSNPYGMELAHDHNFSRERLCRLLTDNGF
jgi:2-polyprenyl-3-methyl-5-hydroxy-6-metoxy-1,4-benzoquinol methylase